MVSLTSLWLPILLSSVIVFVASSIVHMGPFWHRGDFPKLANEDRVMDALRPLAIPPGDYFMPRAATPAEMHAPEYVEKMKKGPVVLMTVMPSGMMAMTKNLVQWFVFVVVVGIFTAYISGRALPPGTPYLRVFQIAGATAFIAHSVAVWPMSIWYRRAWSLAAKSTLDGLIYALLTAGTFGWLWPRVM